MSAEENPSKCKMARLIDVYDEEKCTKLEKRHFPLFVDDELTMVLRIHDKKSLCDEVAVGRSKEMDAFFAKYNVLTREDLASSLVVDSKELFLLFGQLVPCVGCRRSAERLFEQLSKFSYPAMHPLVITDKDEVTITRTHQVAPRGLFSIFHIPMNKFLDGHSKKHRRCTLHSLESQKLQNFTTWLNVWQYIAAPCQKKVTTVKVDVLQDTLETYLKKHRFCNECRCKVLRAFHLLTGELDIQNERGYMSTLYEGITRCEKSVHIIVDPEEKLIGKLITRALPELTGSRRERHAKSIEIAQEEVLTCLGMLIFERLHRIQQKVKEAERSWEVTFYVAVEALKRNFELCVESKRGISQLELLCEELDREEMVKQQRREHKRQKRKKKKEKEQERLEQSTEGADTEDESSAATATPDSCTCSGQKAKGGSDTPVHCTCGGAKVVASPQVTEMLRTVTGNEVERSCRGTSGGAVDDRISERNLLRSPSASECVYDCGYSSGNTNETGGTCTPVSSPEGSELACSESCCGHEGDSIHEHENHSRAENRGEKLVQTFHEVFEGEDWACDEENFIPAEDIRQFKAQICNVTQMRLELRQTLRQRFEQMCTNFAPPTASSF